LRAEHETWWARLDWTHVSSVRCGPVVLLFGTGFGATNPVAPTDSVFSGADPLRTLPIIRFGNVSAPVAFGGVVSPGLYQFNLTVPEVPDGDVPITAQIRLELCSRAASSWSASNTKRLTRGSGFANRARQGREPPPGSRPFHVFEFATSACKSNKCCGLNAFFDHLNEASNSTPTK